MMRMATAFTVVAAFVGCGEADAVNPDAGAADAVDAVPVDGAPPDAPRCPVPTVVPVATGSEVTVAGDLGSTLGIFDPSMVYPAGAPGGALAYSSVPDQHSIRTRIALSADAGSTWTFVGEANRPEASVAG